MRARSPRRRAGRVSSPTARSWSTFSAATVTGRFSHPWRPVWMPRSADGWRDMATAIYTARHAMGRTVRGQALVAHDGFSARYDLDRILGVFSRPQHKLAGQSYVGKILVLDTAKGGVATAWMLYEMKSRGIVPLALVLNSVNPILAQGAAFA